MEHLDYPKDFLNLRCTLTCGQAFRWRQDEEGWWTAPIQNAVLRIKEADRSGFLWETYPEKADIELFTSYFRLDDDIPAIYSHLTETDDHMRALVRRFQGLRIVRQNPWETLLSYVCSAANSIPRISRAVEVLSRNYGRFIANVGGIDYYAFPDLTALASACTDEMACSTRLGFRCRTISVVAKQLILRPADWLDSLRSASYEHAKHELTELPGVGAKIADCVCLFSLDKDEAVPVDTHIRQVAERLFLHGVKIKTLTPSAYNRISRMFRKRYGVYAGWAQEYLYLEDLLRGSK